MWFQSLPFLDKQIKVKMTNQITGSLFQWVEKYNHISPWRWVCISYTVKNFCSEIFPFELPVFMYLRIVFFFCPYLMRVISSSVLFLITENSTSSLLNPIYLVMEWLRVKLLKVWDIKGLSFDHQFRYKVIRKLSCFHLPF